MSGANGTTSASRSTLSIVYDASSATYSVTAAGTTQTFRPSDKDGGLSSPAATAYVRTAGNITESLTLTTPTTHEYVGSGFWQRTTQTDSSYQIGLSAFTYGVETTDAAIPRTGSASYDVLLLGTRAYVDVARGLSGQGRLDIDFASGDVLTNGMFREIDLETGQASAWEEFWGGSAQLASDRNGFSGSLNVGGMTGPLDGRFYGPSGEEVGGAFAVAGEWGDSAVGTLTGKIVDEMRTPTLLSLAGREYLDGYQSYVDYSVQPNGWLNAYSWVSAAPDHLVYDPGTKTYELHVYGMALGPHNQVASQTNSRFTTYQLGEGSETTTAKVYNPGAGNDELPLTYTSFMAWQNSTGPVHYQVFGLLAKATEIPRLGNGSYEGVLYGSAGSGTHLYSLHGTTEFNVDFAKASLSGSMTPAGTDLTTGAVVPFGVYQFRNGRFVELPTNQTIGFKADIAAPANLSNVGTLSGLFYGPTANEIGAAFKITDNSAGGGDNLYLDGVIVAKRQ